MPQRSPPRAPRATPPRHRNIRSLPEWIDAALYEFIHSGNHLVKALAVFAREKNFALWSCADPEKKAERKLAIRNRFKYLRSLQSEQIHQFMQGYHETNADPPSSAPSPPPSSPNPPPSSPNPSPTTAPASNPNEGGGIDAAARARTEAFHFDVPSHSTTTSSSSRQADPSNQAPSAANMSLRNSFNQLDFERPENNPKSWWPLRNRNFNINGMVVDKIEAIYAINEVRDAIHTEATMDRDGHIIIREPRVTAYMRTNPDDVFRNADDVIRSSHDEAIARMRTNNEMFRTTKYYVPEGITIRTGPFSAHPMQIHKVFQEEDMDFGEVDVNDLPVLMPEKWVKFIFTINRPNDANSTVRGADIDDLARRFGNVGM